MIHPIRQQPATWLLLLFIVGLYLLLGWHYASKTPAWQVPDEPAHYNYVRQLAQQGRIPVIESGDWNNEYQNQLRATRFDPAYLEGLPRIQYEDHQPPLYYLLLTPVYRASEGELLSLRRASMLLGLGLIVGAFFTIYRVFQAPWLALATAAFTAFIPQYLSIMGGVTNDALALALVGLCFWASAEYLLQPGIGRALVLGLLIGLALLTKSTIYFLAGLGGLALLLLMWRSPALRRQFLPHLAALVLLPLLLGGGWWLRNLNVYGGSDFLGLQRHDEVAAEQLQTQDYIAQELGGDEGAYFKNLAYTTFHSFWGQFGWMAVPMPTMVYRLLLLALLGITLGSGLYAYLAGWPGSLMPSQRDLLLLFSFTLVAVLAAFLLYNRQFVQFQGRYLFPALLPLGFWVAIGLSGWVEYLLRLGLSPLLRWLPVGVLLLLAAFAWYALHSYLVPNL